MKFARLEDPRSRDDEEIAAEAWANSVSKLAARDAIEDVSIRVAHLADTGVKLDGGDTSLVLEKVKHEPPILFVVAMSLCAENPSLTLRLYNLSLNF